MEPHDRKLQQRIIRRKEKLHRLIKEQEDRLATLDSITFLRQEDYQKAVNKVREKLYRLEQELSALEDGQVPNGWI